MLDFRVQYGIGMLHYVKLFLLVPTVKCADTVRIVHRAHVHGGQCGWPRLYMFIWLHGLYFSYGLCPSLELRGLHNYA